MSAKLFDSHATVVAELQDDVKHTPRSPPPPRSSPAVAVCSPTPKLSPVTVTDAYPLCGAFCSTPDAVGESKLNTAKAVPATAPTVTNVRSIVGFAAMLAVLAVWHVTVVPELHVDVKHVTCASIAVCVCSALAKFSPVTVTDA